LGSGIKESQYFPIKIIIDELSDSSDQLDVLDLSAGKNHVGVICRKRPREVNDQEDQCLPNCLYMWGSNKYGQLGLWDFEDRSTP
jgi:Regulator of chromosome condensation (RCC1) repeat